VSVESKELIVVTLIVTSFVIVTGVAIAINDYTPSDPDYYKNPYYTLSYKKSNDVITVGELESPDCYGMMTYLYRENGSGFTYTGGMMGSTGSHVWMDIKIEVYGAPNTPCRNGVYFRSNVAYSSIEYYYWYSNVNGIDEFNTDNNGQYTFTFSIGVPSDYNVGIVKFPQFGGAPRSITLLP